MVTFQIPLPGLARTFDSLTEAEKQFIEYFSLIDAQCFAPVLSCYAGIRLAGFDSDLKLNFNLPAESSPEALGPASQENKA